MEIRPGRVTNSHPYWIQRLKETFERDQLEESDVCSDDVLRGLGYKDYEPLFAGKICRGGSDGVGIDVER